MGDWLPVAIEGVTDRCKEEEDYILNDDEKERVVAFYAAFGYTDIWIERIVPWIGPMRDEVCATPPDGWTTEWSGYWGHVFDQNGVKQFSIFWKGAPWDYCTFVRR